MSDYDMYDGLSYDERLIAEKIGAIERNEVHSRPLPVNYDMEKMIEREIQEQLVLNKQVQDEMYRRSNRALMQKRGEPKYLPTDIRQPPVDSFVGGSRSQPRPQENFVSSSRVKPIPALEGTTNKSFVDELVADKFLLLLILLLIVVIIMQYQMQQTLMSRLDMLYTKPVE